MILSYHYPYVLLSGSFNSLMRETKGPFWPFIMYGYFSHQWTYALGYSHWKSKMTRSKWFHSHKMVCYKETIQNNFQSLYLELYHKNFFRPLCVICMLKNGSSVVQCPRWEGKVVISSLTVILDTKKEAGQSKGKKHWQVFVYETGLVDNLVCLF